ncbi:hypothetical protein BC829DRAFT_63228 [Chytridium lagenaria]|nr:hypothetical protein BC829DRAFT_63228 [Chytridium lagenaria]
MQNHTRNINGSSISICGEGLGSESGGTGVEWTVTCCVSAIAFLSVMSLHSNDWSSTIPDAYRTMKSLTVMHFFQSGVRGPLPSWLGELTEIEIFNVDYSAVSGPVPDSIRQWSRLRGIWLGHNNLFGDVSSIFTKSNHPVLETLDLTSNFISGRVDPSLENTRSIRLDENCMVVSENLIARQRANEAVLVLPPRTSGCNLAAIPPPPAERPSVPLSVFSNTDAIPTATGIMPSNPPASPTDAVISGTINQSDVLATITESGRPLIISQLVSGNTTVLFTLTSPPAIASAQPPFTQGNPTQNSQTHKPPPNPLNPPTRSELLVFRLLSEYSRLHSLL